MNKKIFLSFLAFNMLLFPFAAFADVSLFPTGYWGPLVSCSGVDCNVCHLFSTAQMVIYFIMTLTLFVIGPIMITIGGMMMLVSGGSEERFSSGRKMATGAVWGILIALGAFLIVNTLLSAIASQTEGFGGSGFTISCSATSPFNPTNPFSGNAGDYSGEQYNPPLEDNPGGNTPTF
ncbi:MAG: hypothetical protein HY432_02835 [Candidatus Liptonbacteria bacterium]|nr:hypothetical protein [Candidatus Liptonbacteria bacterium]